MSAYAGVRVWRVHIWRVFLPCRIESMTRSVLDNCFDLCRCESMTSAYLTSVLPWRVFLPCGIESMTHSVLDDGKSMTSAYLTSVHILENWEYDADVLDDCFDLCRCESMTSAYLMVRSGLCPYVYVCCHHMTVMMRAAGVVRSEVHAVLTPTTRGIRAALEADGNTSVFTNLCRI